MLKRQIVLVLSLLLAPLLVFAPGTSTAVLAGGGAPQAYSLAVWPDSGTISFDVLRGEGGLKLGEARHRWEHDGERYAMTTEVETTGLAGLLYSFQYVQRSEGWVLEHGLRPERFRVERAGKDPESAQFHWPAGKVVIERRGKTAEYPIRPPDQDVLSVWHLVGLLNGGAPPAELTLVTGREAAAADLEVIGREALRLPIGNLDALHVRARAHSGRLTIDLWLSEQHHLLPVRIRMTDEKGEMLDQRAVSIAFTHD